MADSLFSELKRRNVFKVGIAYLVLAWVVIQVTDTAVPALHLPEWIITAVLFFGVIGFPFAIFFAWIFELTPEGVKRESEISTEDSLAAHTGRKLDFIIIALLVIGLIYFVYESRFTNKENSNVESGASSSEVQSTSEVPTIAVLPFVNMSSDPEQEYFSDGITEEILNTLVRINNLKVIARTSAFAYKGKNPDLREVGKTLGANYILEGSVRKSGKKLRITAQLINTNDGAHLWSEVYDRELTEIFEIQDEIASSIAKSLAISLGLQEGQTLVEDRINDMAAYEKYLRAGSIIKKREKASFHFALELLTSVVKTEPEYAPGHAALSLLYNVIPFYLKEFNGKEIDLVAMQYKSEVSARKAVSLNSNLASARHVLANALRWRHQWIAAEEQYILARTLDPNSVAIIEDYGEFFSWLGKYQQAFDIAKLGLELERSSSFPYMRYLDALISLPNPTLGLKESLAAELKHPSFPIIQYNIINAYLILEQYQEALEYFKKCHDCAGMKSSININVIESYLKGEELDIYLNDKDILLAQFEILHLVGGKELILKALRVNLLDTPAFHFNTVSFSSPVMNDVRTDERYKYLIVQFGMVDYWRERGWPNYCRPLSDYDFECGNIK